MTTVFYKPSTGYLADVIPFFDDSVFHLFYLHDFRDRPSHGEGTPWYRISTRDFVHFQQAGEMIPRGTAEDQDLYAYTGCAIKAMGQYHIFYTGHNPHFPRQGKPREGVMHAVSQDMIHWRKVPEDTFFAPAGMGYERDDWRDPFVFFDEPSGLYHMLLAARQTEGPAVARGCTAHCVSRDLRSWQVVEPLWSPQLYYTHECPDLFKMGDWYYLIFSEFSDRCQTRYVMSRSLQGPWISPAQDTFDSRAFYAAKSCSDGDKRYLFGWNPTREDESDDRRFMWGGNLTAHELYAKPDGTLAVREPESLTGNWLKNETDMPGRVHLSRPDGYCQHVFPYALPARYRLTCTVRAEHPSGAFGVRLRYGEKEDASLAYVFDQHAGQVRFERMPNHPWTHIENNSLNRPFALVPGQPLSITLVVEETVVCLYLGGEVAFSTRAYEGQGDGLALFCSHGEVTYEDITLYTWKP